MTPHVLYEFTDYLTLLSIMVFICVFSIIITEAINFVPDFIKSLVQSVTNKSIQNHDNLLDKNNLHDLDIEQKTLNWGDHSDKR